MLKIVAVKITRHMRNPPMSNANDAALERAHQQHLDSLSGVNDPADDDELDAACCICGEELPADRRDVEPMSDGEACAKCVERQARS